MERGGTDLFLFLGHLIPSLVDLEVDGVGLQLLALADLILQVLPHVGTGGLGEQKGGSQRAFGGVGVPFLLFALALLVFGGFGCSDWGCSGGGGCCKNLLGDVVDGRGRGGHGGIGGVCNTFGQLEALDGALFASEDRGSVLDVSAHQVIQAILNMSETLLNIGEA